MKKKYYAVKWDNYMGSGSVVEVELTPDEYKHMKETWCRDTPYWGIYDNWLEADCALDRRYAD